MFHVKHSVFFTPRVPTHREQPRPTGARTPQEPEHREKPHNVQRETRAGAQRATQAGAQRASVSRETLRLFHPAGAHSPQVAAFRGCPSDMGMFHVKHSFSSGAIADNAQRDALTPAKEKAAWCKSGPPGAGAGVNKPRRGVPGGGRRLPAAAPPPNPPHPPTPPPHKNRPLFPRPPRGALGAATPPPLREVQGGRRLCPDASPLLRSGVLLEACQEIPCGYLQPSRPRCPPDRLPANCATHVFASDSMTDRFSKSSDHWQLNAPGSLSTALS